MSLGVNNFWNNNYIKYNNNNNYIKYDNNNNYIKYDNNNNYIKYDNNNNYIKYESNGDKNENLSFDEYLNKTETYWRNIIINLQNSDT